jgi:hypothetical protein
MECPQLFLSLIGLFSAWLLAASLDPISPSFFQLVLTKQYIHVVQQAKRRIRYTMKTFIHSCLLFLCTPFLKMQVHILYVCMYVHLSLGICGGLISRIPAHTYILRCLSPLYKMT